MCVVEPKIIIPVNFILRWVTRVSVKFSSLMLIAPVFRQSILVVRWIVNEREHSINFIYDGWNLIAEMNENGQQILSVGDDGVGIAEQIDLQNAQTLGLQLVDTLTTQLDGTLSLLQDGGTTFEIAFAGS